METNAYDGNGNPTTYSSGSASYDEENRLTAFPAGAQVWGAGYRADGLRAWTRKTATGAKTYYYYDQGNAVLETKADGTMVGMNIFAPGGLVTRWSKLSGTIPVVGDYQFDWQGNAVHCLFSGARYSDEPLIHSAYSAWGQRNFVYSNGAGSVSDLLRFGYNARWGYKLDTETGLYYCQQRYYDPQNGRWVTRDPIGPDGGVNLYGYCGDRLVSRSDQTGLSPSVDCVKAALIKALYVAGASALKDFLTDPTCMAAILVVIAGVLTCPGLIGLAGPTLERACGPVVAKALIGSIIAGGAAFVWEITHCPPGDRAVEPIIRPIQPAVPCLENLPSQEPWPRNAPLVPGLVPDVTKNVC